MRLVMMNGGLGNQAFQYIFMRYIEEMSGESCIIDDLAFCGKTVSHNGYELEKIFSIKHARLSELLDRDVIDEMLRLTAAPQEAGQKPESILTVFKSCGIDLFPIQEGYMYQDVCNYTGSIFSTPANEFYPDILRCTGDLYYYGYWINARWFASIASKILKEFTFPAPPDAKNQSYLSQIQAADTRSVAVHIRRGDFISLGWAMSPAFYQKTIPAAREQAGKPVFFLLSDDIPWVRDHMDELGFLPSDECVFVEGNMGGNNYIDMQLMSACRGMIIANSSFSYLASLLNIRTDKFVFNPTPREIIYYGQE